MKKRTIRHIKTKKPLKIESFISCIPWEQIEEAMGKREYKRFCKWMSGQTCLRQGVYREDLARYLEGLPIID